MVTHNDFAKRRRDGWVERRRELRRVWERTEALRTAKAQDDAQKEAPKGNHE